MKAKYNIIFTKESIKGQANKRKIQRKPIESHLNLNINLAIYIVLLLILPKSSLEISVHLKVSAAGEQNVLWPDFPYKPNIVYYNYEGEEITINNAYRLDVPDANTQIRLDWGDYLYNCEKMFYQLENIKEIDFNYFDTSNVVNMDYMFANCANLETINNLKAASITSMNYIFQNCRNLIYLNLYNFDASNVEYMISAFEGCSKLETIDGLNNFNPQNLKDMAAMFSDCNKIGYLNLEKFDTSQVTDMNSLFNNCESLSTLIIHFNTEKVNIIISLIVLRYIDN